MALGGAAHATDYRVSGTILGPTGCMLSVLELPEQPRYKTTLGLWKRNHCITYAKDNVLSGQRKKSKMVFDNGDKWTVLLISTSDTETGIVKVVKP
jgi:hypothetical protein